MVLHGLVVVLCACCLIYVNTTAREKRKIPAVAASGQTRIIKLAAQRDAYDVYHAMELWGAAVIHFNRFLNLVEYYPVEEQQNAPFPIRTADIRPLYEKGLDSHNWLFIANRTGLVRTVTVILPEVVFKQKAVQFRSSFYYTMSGPVVFGHARDLPFIVATLRDLPAEQEPVVVNVDAGFFTSETDPSEVALKLTQRCPDVRVLALIESRDEPDVTLEMRKKLDLFSLAYQAFSRARKDESHD